MLEKGLAIITRKYTEHLMKNYTLKNRINSINNRFEALFIKKLQNQNIFIIKIQYL